jgi:hypothetical protein
MAVIMSEANPNSAAKLKLMDAIQGAIDKTGLATAKVWNPWNSVLDEQVSTKEVVASVGSSAVPDVISDSRQFASLRGVEKTAFGTAAQLGGPVTPDNFADAKKRLRRAYLQVGAASYKNLAGANCTLFACAVIGMLADQAAIIPDGTTVELLNLLGAGSGHAYVVINRTGGTLEDPATYGPDAFLVDQWYARQQFTDQGKLGVKDPRILGHSRYADLNFYAWISDEPKIAVRLLFTKDDLAGFRT